MAQFEIVGEVRNCLYLRSEHLWQWSLILAIAMVLLVIFGLWDSSRIVLELAGIAAIILPIVIVWMRESATTYLIRGDRCRRLMLYADGLGQEITPIEAAEARAWSVGNKLRATSFSSPYYSSNYPPGIQRLADIATESAFFSENLARKLQVSLWIMFGILIVASVSALFLADLDTKKNVSGIVLASKSIAVFIGFLISGDFAIIAKKFGDLRQEAHYTYQRCAQFRSDPSSSHVVVRAVIESYNIALTQCPPIPSWLYRCYRDELNDIYQESHGLRKE